MTNNLEIEIKKLKKQAEGFTFTSEDNDRKRVYLIYSSELKRKLRELVFPFGVISEQCQAKYQGKIKKTGDRVLYQKEKGEENPDKLVLISGKYSKAITEGNEELLKQQEIERQEEAEKKRLDGLWEKEMERREISPSTKVVKHYFCGRDKDRKIVVEGIGINSETRFLIQQQEHLPKKS